VIISYFPKTLDRASIFGKRRGSLVNYPRLSEQCPQDGGLILGKPRGSCVK
jgi:hypothetical protein